MRNVDQEQLEEELAELSSRHENMDSAIKQLQESLSIDQLKISRLKKEKLMLKEQIEKIKSSLIPDQKA